MLLCRRDAINPSGIAIGRGAGNPRSSSSVAIFAAPSHQSRITRMIGNLAGYGGDPRVELYFWRD